MKAVPGWLSVKQAADELGVTPEAVYGLAKRGALGEYRIGELRVISRVDLDAYKERTVNRQRPGRRPGPKPGQTGGQVPPADQGQP